MFRVFPLLALGLLPVAVAAPVPPGAGRPEFGTNGLLTRADLDKVVFDTKPARDRGEEQLDDPKDAGGEKAVGPARCEYDLAVHMPWTAFRAGEPIPAYFVLRNNRREPLHLDARLELFGPSLATWNSCAIDLRNARTGDAVPLIRRTGWQCGGGGLVDVPANGFYCVRGDIGHTTDGAPLPPGEYEIRWRCVRLVSAPTRFTVVKADEPKPQFVRRHAVDFYHLSPAGRTSLPGNPGSPVVWRECRLDHVYAGALASALATGHDGVYVPDLHTIPSADRLVEATLTWKPYRAGDRLAVTLRAVSPLRPVVLADMPDFHLQLDADDKRLWDKVAEEPKGADHPRRGDLVLPLTVEFTLPADWRERTGVEGPVRIAVVVTATRPELPVGSAVRRIQAAQDVKRLGGDQPPAWSGVLRTAPVEVEFPPHP